MVSQNLVTNYSVACRKIENIVRAQLASELDKLILSNDELSVLLEKEFGITDFRPAEDDGKSLLQMRKQDYDAALEAVDQRRVEDGHASVQLENKPRCVEVARAVARRGRLLQPEQVRALIGYVRDAWVENWRAGDEAHARLDPGPGALCFNLVVRHRVDPTIAWIRSKARLSNKLDNLALDRPSDLSWIDDRQGQCAWYNLPWSSTRSTENLDYRAPLNAHDRVFRGVPLVVDLVPERAEYFRKMGAAVTDDQRMNVVLPGVELDLGVVDPYRHRSLLYRHRRMEVWRNSVRKLFVLGNFLPEEIADEVISFGEDDFFSWDEVAVMAASRVYNRFGVRGGSGDEVSRYVFQDQVSWDADIDDSSISSWDDVEDIDHALGEGLIELSSDEDG